MTMHGRQTDVTFTLAPESVFMDLVPLKTLLEGVWWVRDDGFTPSGYAPCQRQYPLRTPHEEVAGGSANMKNT